MEYFDQFKKLLMQVESKCFVKGDFLKKCISSLIPKNVKSEKEAFGKMTKCRKSV